MREDSPAPTTGQARTNTSTATALMIIGGGQSVIRFVPPPDCWSVDARLPGGRFARYVSDPTTGIWRVVGSYPREQISPLALQLITVGRHEIEVELTHPQTGNVWSFEGDPDTVATLLWRAGQRYGCQAERKTVYWALREFCAAVRRQAARGVEQ